MHLDQQLIDAATSLLKDYYLDTGGIAAAMYTEHGEILTGVMFNPDWCGGGLCA